LVQIFTGTNALANEDGIQIDTNASNNTIGGTGTGEANTIAFNNKKGIFVITGTGNLISANRIFENGELGIDLGNNGVTINDVGDSDTGVNNLQNFPVLNSVLVSGGNTTITGSLNSTPNQTFTIQFFSNTVLDASGYGEGETYLGSTSVTTDASGNASFSVLLPASVSSGQSITATATDSNNNTSEFSEGLIVNLADLKTTITGITNGSSGDYTYTIETTNLGSDSAVNVTIQSQLATGATFLNASDGGTENAGVVTWTIPNLNVGQTIMRTVTVNLGTDGSYTNIASSSSDTPDPILTNNDGSQSDARLTTVVLNQADLALISSVSNANPTLGDTISLTLTLSNDGPDLATNVEIRNLLPSGLSLVSASPSQGIYTNGIWRLDSINSNGSETLTIEAVVSSGGTLNNRAEIITSNQFDPDSTPNNNIGTEDDQTTLDLNVFIPAPEIEVFASDGTLILDDSGSYNFGSTTIKTPLIANFSIKNSGTASLTLDPASLSLPDGFSLLGSFPNAIAPGSESNFQLQLNASAIGAVNGQISFATNDSDENPYNFAINGIVEPLAVEGTNPAFDLIGLTKLRNDPQFNWSVDGTPNSNNLLTGGKRFSVAVIDSEVDSEHPLLIPNYLTGKSFAGIGDEREPATVKNTSDFAHGTHVAGTIGASDPNIGVAPGVGLIGLNGTYRKHKSDKDGNLILDEDGNKTYKGQLANLYITQSLEWLINQRNNYDVVAVNMSLGSGPYLQKDLALKTLTDQTHDKLIKDLEKLGVTVVATAGNDYGEFARNDNRTAIPNPENKGVNSPGIYSSLLIGAVWDDGTPTEKEWINYFGAKDDETGVDRIASFSQRLDTENMLFAPGTFIRSTIPLRGKGEITPASGTSMAAPHVAGAVAIFQEASLELGGRKLTPETIVTYFTAPENSDVVIDGDDERTNVKPTQKGYQRLNIYKSVQALQTKFNSLGQDIDGTREGAKLFTSAYLPFTLENDQGQPTPYNFPFLGSIGIDGVSNNVGATDVDLYRIQLEDIGQQLNINLLPHPTDPTDNFNAILRLFDEEGNFLTSAELPVDGSGSLTYNNLDNIDPNKPTDLFVGVSGVGNNNYNATTLDNRIAGTTGNYKLTFDLSVPDIDGTEDTAPLAELESDGSTTAIQGAIGSDGNTAVNTLSDVDMQKIVIPDDGVVFIDIDTENANFVKSFLRVFDAAGNPVTLNDGNLAENNNAPAVATTPTGNSFEVVENPTNNSDSFLYFQAAKGQTYYIGISEESVNEDYNAEYLAQRPDAATGGEYTLNLTFYKNNPNSNPLNAPSDISDPDGSISLAQGLTATPLPIANQKGIIGTDIDPFSKNPLEVGNNDVDFYKVNSPTTGLLSVSVDSLNNPNITDPLEAVLLLLTENGTPIASTGNSNTLDADTGVSDRDPRLIYEIEANTDYFIAVTGEGTDDFDPELMGSGSPGDTGEYILNSEVLELEELSRLSDDKIGNEGIREIAIGDELFGEVGSDRDLIIGATDIDLYRFNATISGQIQIRTQTNGEFSADTYLRLFDAAGNEIAANDDENELTRGSFLTANVIRGQTYYIGVNGASNQAGEYNPITGEGVVAGVQGDYLLTLDGPQPRPQPQPDAGILSKKDNNLFAIAGTAGEKMTFRLSIMQVNTASVSEIGVIKVDDDLGSIDGKISGNSDYLLAAMERATVVASALPDSTFPRFNSDRLLEFDSGDRLLFYMVQNSTTDTVLSYLKQGMTPPNVFFATGTNVLNASASGSDRFTLQWEDQFGGSIDFNDIEIVLEYAPNAVKSLGTKWQGENEREIIDLRDVGTQQATLVLDGEAMYSNTVGFYLADDETGRIGNLQPGDSGYAKMAIEERRVLQLERSGTSFSDLEGLLVPFIIANAQVQQFLADNPDNLANGNAIAYFPYMAANPDGVDHIRLLGDNTFGFEDLPNGGDLDYNDMVFQVTFG
jgi:uncharacterized repeat protein (TIGR01451 family)